MRKLIITVGASLAVFVAACADSPEKNAGREYVNAARKVAKAEKAFAAADYKTALELCETARSEVERVVDKYPESAIALKVMTDDSTLVGPCKYSELSGRIIPLLKTFENPALADAELAWAIAMSNADAARRDAALAELAEAVAASPKIHADKASKIRAAIVSNIKSPELRGRLNAAKQPAQQAAKLKASASAAAPQTRKIADTAAFLRAASTDASLVAYDVRTIDNLREKAKSAAFADNAVKREFVKILASAQNNIEKISAKNLREKALGGIAAAFANFGDDARAIETAKKISDPETFAAAFAEIADVVGRGKNSAAAAALAERLANSAERDAFFAKLSQGISARGNFAEAQANAAKISDISSRNLAYAACAKTAFDAGKPNDAAKLVAAIDVSNLDCLSVFDGGDEAGTYGAEILPAARLAKISSMLAGSNADFAEALNALAADRVRASGTEKTAGYAALCGKIARNTADLGRPAEALKFLSGCLRDRDVSAALLGDLYYVAEKSDAATAFKAYKLASDICAAAGRGEITLALTVQLGGLKRAECAEILAPFLPKFK